MCRDTLGRRSYKWRLRLRQILLEWFRSNPRWKSQALAGNVFLRFHVEVDSDELVRVYTYHVASIDLSGLPSPVLWAMRLPPDSAMDSNMPFWTFSLLTWSENGKPVFHTALQLARAMIRTFGSAKTEVSLHEFASVNRGVATVLPSHVEVCPDILDSAFLWPGDGSCSTSSRLYNVYIPG